MMYVMLILVVALALISGAEFALVKCLRAEAKASTAELRYENHMLKEKVKVLFDKNNELNKQMVKLSNIKEGVNNE